MPLPKALVQGDGAVCALVRLRHEPSDFLLALVVVDVSDEVRAVWRPRNSDKSDSELGCSALARYRAASPTTGLIVMLSGAPPRCAPPAAPALTTRTCIPSVTATSRSCTSSAAGGALAAVLLRLRAGGAGWVAG